MTTLLVATDFSATAERALREAIDLAKAIGARIGIVHVHVVKTVPVPPTLDLVTVTPKPAEVADAEVSLATLGKLVKDAGVECSTYSAFGAPADEVVRRAGDVGARTIVVGRHGHRAVTEVLVGSVAARVIHLATCGVLVVPPAGRAK